MTYKSTVILTLGIVACALAVPAPSPGQTASSSKRGTIQNAATNDSLTLALRKAQQTKKVELIPLEKVDTEAVAKPKGDLLSQSDIICFNGLATLVPKRAVIAVPERYQSRLEFKTGAKLTTWDKFYASNRAWISLLEVEFEQATGEKSFSEAQAAAMQNSSRMIVATYNKGPVSVLPPQKPTPPADAVGENIR